MQASSMTSHEIAARFERIALAHSGFMLNLARKLTGNETHAEDLYQDTYYKAFRSFDKFDGEAKCRAWLKRIMINTFINMYNRKQKVVFYYATDEDFDRFEAAKIDIERPFDTIDPDSFLRESVSDEIKRSLMLLPESYRTVVIMYDMLGLTYKEIALKVKAPLGTVKSRLFRGRSALKLNLQRYYNDTGGRFAL